MKASVLANIMLTWEHLVSLEAENSKFILRQAIKQAEQPACEGCSVCVFAHVWRLSENVHQASAGPCHHRAAHGRVKWSGEFRTHTCRLKIAALPFCTLSCWGTRRPPRWSPVHCCCSVPWSRKGPTGKVSFSCGQKVCRFIRRTMLSGHSTPQPQQEPDHLYNPALFPPHHSSIIHHFSPKLTCRHFRRFALSSQGLDKDIFKRGWFLKFAWQPVRYETSPNREKVQLAKEWLGPSLTFIAILGWDLICGARAALHLHTQKLGKTSSKPGARSPDNSRCGETTHRRCRARLRCSSKCILCFRASIVGALERITCTLQPYHYFLLYDTHTTAPGGLVCSTQQHSPLHANSGVMSPAWARSSSTTLFFSASNVHFCIAAANKIK